MKPRLITVTPSRWLLTLRESPHTVRIIDRVVPAPPWPPGQLDGAPDHFIVGERHFGSLTDAAIAAAKELGYHTT
jgi:hypothetical protein